MHVLHTQTWLYKVAVMILKYFTTILYKLQVTHFLWLLLSANVLNAFIPVDFVYSKSILSLLVSRHSNISI